jgi:hypothetical protein
MTKMVQEAIAALKDLPEDRQATIARATLEYASHDDGLYYHTRIRATIGRLEFLPRFGKLTDEIGGPSGHRARVPLPSLLHHR